MSLDAGVVDASGDVAPSAVGWQSALSRLQQSGGQIYSFLFNDSSGKYSVRFDTHLTDASSACARYTGSTEVLVGDFWYLQTDLTGADPGLYPIVYDELDMRSGKPAALVTLLHRQDGTFVNRYSAVTGTVALTSSATLDSFRQGEALIASVSAQFPDHGVESVHCMGGQAAGSSVVTMSCQCIDDNRVESTCDVLGGRSACCQDLTSKRIDVQIGVTAAPCRSMCRHVVGAPDYCSTLL